MSKDNQKNENKQIFKDNELAKQISSKKVSRLEKFFNSAKGPKVFFEDENEQNK